MHVVSRNVAIRMGKLENPSLIKGFA